MASYNDEFKNWMARTSFYLSIILFSFWEAVTSHSISKIYQSNSNIIWKITEKVNNENNTEFKDLLTLVTTLTSQKQFDENNTGIANFQDFLISIAGNNDKRYFDTPFVNLIEKMGKIQKYTDTFGILSIPKTSFERKEDKKERKRIDDFYDNNKIVEDMYLSFMEVWTFMNVTMINVLSLIAGFFKESNDSKLKNENSIIGVYNLIIKQINNEDNGKKPSIINSQENDDDTLTDVFTCLHSSWIFFIFIIIFCFFSQKNNDTTVEVALFILTLFFLHYSCNKLYKD